MNYLFADTETAPIAPGLQAPPLVCLQYAIEDDAPSIIRAQDGASRMFWNTLAEPDTVFVGHNASYDLLVLLNDVLQREGYEAFLDALFILYRALEEDRVLDTFVRELLVQAATGNLQMLGRGSFSLDACAQRAGFHALDKPNEKEKGWDATAYLLGLGPPSTATALSYWGLRHLPVSAWPARHVAYALEDVEATRHVFWKQPFRQPTECHQVRCAWALHVTAANGMLTDPENIRHVRGREQLQSNKHREVLFQPLGIGDTPKERAQALLWVDKHGEEHIRTGLLRKLVKITCEEKDLDIPYVVSKKPRDPKKPPNISTSKETLNDLKDHIPLAEAYLERQASQKLLNTFLPLLEKAPVVHTRYVPVVSTGRSSSAGPNVQNLPRAPGIRESFVARWGKVLSSCDFSVLELRTLAQVCHTLGWHSDLREAFIAGRDPHDELGADIAAMVTDLSEEPRQLAKGGNFGVPGGLGPETFQKFLRVYAKGPVPLSVCKVIINLTKNKWSEFPTFFRYVSNLRSGEWHNVVCPVTGFVRGQARYTAACNTHFQGLAAYGAKGALYEVVKACHTNPALAGSYPIAFIHDEILSEHPEECAEQHASIIAEIMRSAMVKHATPDVPQVVKPTLMFRWHKKAKPVFDDEGNLVPWDAELL